MSFAAIRLILILSALVLYTAHKITPLWPNHRKRCIAAAFLLFAWMLGAAFAYRGNPAIFNTLWFRALTWSGYVVFGLWATYMILSLPFDILRLFHSVARKFSPRFDFDPARRQFFTRSLTTSIAGLSGTFSTIGFSAALHGPNVKTATMTFPNLPRSLRGLKIAQISDLHVGPTIQQAYVEAVVQQVNALDPDLIFMTGDLADGRTVSLAPHLEPLRGLKSRFGTYYVTGNHEYYWNADEMTAHMASLGWTPLLNEHRVIAIGDEKILVAGIPDPQGAHVSLTHTPDPKQAIASAVPVSLKILLAHRPDACNLAEPLGFDAQFSGHTHAGQFFPFSLFIGLAHRYTRGLYQHGRMWLYVNPGTGYWGPPNRFGVRSEITLVTFA